jgi:polyisoprenoid-binding protein YceI
MYGVNMYKYITLLFLILVTNVFSQEYHVNHKKDNLVKFISDAKIEKFEGVTEKIDGYILMPGDNNLYEAEVYFEVDLNSVDTGIGLRNRHMREDYLHTDKYPITSFKGKINNVTKEGNAYKVKSYGDMTIHGVTKKQTIEATVEFVKGGIAVKTDFIVKLTDYEIKVPELMFMKISEEIQLVLDFNLRKVD